MSYRKINIFCAAAGGLEAEREAFYRAVARVNETEAMRAAALFAQLSVLPTLADKRRFQVTVDHNIRLCTYFLLVLDDSWGPESKNFEAEYRLALACRADP